MKVPKQAAWHIVGTFKTILLLYSTANVLHATDSYT